MKLDDFIPVNVDLFSKDLDCPDPLLMGHSKVNSLPTFFMLFAAECPPFI